MAGKFKPLLNLAYFQQTSSQTALIIGATGQTGRHLLQNLLASPHFSHVGEYGRRVTPTEEITTGKDKLEQKTIDFEKISESGLKQKNWDVVFITLGTTRANAGSAEAFEKIDREYVLAAAKEARSSDPSASQRLVYLSSGGANSSSPFLYPKSKGLTEEGLASLGYSDTIIFRPGFLAGTNRSDHRLAESVFGKITGVLSYVTSAVEINIRTLGKAMAEAGRLGSASLPPAVHAAQAGKDGAKFTVINNAGAIKLAELTK
ncbi:Protein FMP52, mitochondrial [Psilocybe cubensis]|uniref:Protein FMP52, mitochondrial n=2 Tax=Psilocybe cubensis TaxID=181762 RepID=A0ACB8GV38_PSICU|nr:Protein FMP52, mitochondrial [Psilocybe cubensis]KAH9479324.1 Protein FMP52, mitochondrial [Psilocybe cubensis]